MKTISRRGLLGLRKSRKPERQSPRRRSSEPQSTDHGFSLEGFYQARRERGEATGTDVPRFEVRYPGPVETSSVGRIDGAASSELEPAPVAPRSDGALVARIRPQGCLARSSFCTTCSERCPEPGAIELQEGMPVVVASRCSGCGICAQVCPAPVQAIELFPRPEP